MKLHFEDLKEGTVFRGDECTVQEDELLEYARRNDPLPFHLDEQAAKASPYAGVIASGGYTVTLWYRSGIPIFAQIAFLGGFDWHIKLPLPVRAGDRLQVEITIVGKRPSTKPGRGYVTTSQRLLNQDGNAVFLCDIVWIVATKD
jgi:acyl dehydratase